MPIEMKLKPFSKNSPTRSVPNRNRPRVMPFFFAFVIWARGHGALRGDGRKHSVWAPLWCRRLLRRCTTAAAHQRLRRLV